METAKAATLGVEVKRPERANRASKPWEIGSAWGEGVEDICSHWVEEGTVDLPIRCLVVLAALTLMNDT